MGSMKHPVVRSCLVSCLALAVFALSAPPTAAQDPADETAAIKAEYQPLLAEYSRLFLKPQGTDAVAFALEKNMVSTGLKKLLKADQRLRNKDGMGRLDFDPLTGAQDDCGKPLQILGIAREKTTYLMTVSIGCKGVSPFKYVFVKESGRWVMDDAQYTFDGKIVTLQSILKGK